TPVEAPRPDTRPAPPPRPRAAPPRRLEVFHRTSYRYDKPVERSTHLLRFEPVSDRLQRLARHELRVSVDGQWRDYTDVFGNRARRLVLDRPFTELSFESHSQVVTLDTDPFEFRPLHAAPPSRSTGCPGSARRCSLSCCHRNCPRVSSSNCTNMP
ncbi:MAG TPA: transglutaminase N-terminal domain-containing protein, partial [Myxococcota bacterium]|nr:transglutaminase N-terminal domain-containing protein [Myxococcota bacterium]